MTDPSAAPVVEIVGLSKRFGAGVLAVDDLSFTVERGQVCGLLGPNGAGKTTSLRVLLGLVRATAGEARLFGEPVRPGSAQLRRVGALIESAAFVPHLSGMRNLRLWWEANGADWSDAHLDEALAIADLGTAIDRKVKTYSQGMRQRLGLARVLLGQPEVLVLDEPTNGLDPQEMREVRQLVHRVAASGATVLFSSHVLAEVEQTCSHAVVMDRGKFVAGGSVAALIGTAGSVYLEVSDVTRAQQVLAALPGVVSVTPEAPGLSVDMRDNSSRAEMVKALVDAGVGVDTVMVRRRLEDAFLGLVEAERVVTALLGTELFKALKRLRTYVAFAIVIGIPVIMTIAVHANPPDGRGGNGPGGGLFYLATQTGLIMPAAALRLMSGFLLVIIVAVFGGDAMAGDASSGNLRYILMRPIRRGRLVAAKFTAAMLCAWLATTLVVLAGLVAGGIAFGFGGLSVPFVTSLSQGTGELLGHLAIATGYVAWSLTGVVAFSFLVSCTTDAPAGAIFAGVGLYITSSILDAIDSVPSGIRNILPTHYFDSWIDMFTQHHVSSDMAKGALLQLVYVAVFLAIGYWWFRRKDILS